MKTVLIVEDEDMIRDAVSSYLKKQGWMVLEADDGATALRIFEKEKITFVILDLMLPDMDGEKICEIIRSKSNVPVLMLTAKMQEEDILNGLSAGADDYMTKPFSLKELFARMNVIMRRYVTYEKQEVSLTPAWKDQKLLIDLEHREVRYRDELIAVTPIEWKILEAFIKYPKKIYTREELLNLAFGSEHDSYDRVVDTHIKNLRKKLEEDPKNPQYIKTVHGVGYKFGGDDI